MARNDAAESQLIATDRKDGYGELVDLEGQDNIGQANDTRQSNLFDEEESKLVPDEEVVDESLF